MDIKKALVIVAFIVAYFILITLLVDGSSIKDAVAQRLFIGNNIGTVSAVRAGIEIDVFRFVDADTVCYISVMQTGKQTGLFSQSMECLTKDEKSIKRVSQW